MLTFPNSGARGRYSKEKAKVKHFAELNEKFNDELK